MLGFPAFIPDKNHTLNATLAGVLLLFRAPVAALAGALPQETLTLLLFRAPVAALRGRCRDAPPEQVGALTLPQGT